MKHNYSLTLAVVLSSLFFFKAIHAQSPQCPADYSQRMLLQDPAKLAKMRQDNAKIRELMKNHSRNAVPDTLKIIPIVVHVLHDNGKGAITKANIIAGINEMNIDLRKLNSDTTLVRPFFKSLVSDLKVEMRLAQIDPDGNCTDGIQYYNTPFTYNVSDTCKSVAGWPPDKYFNFWIVNSIDPSPWGLSGTIIGYEKFPWFGINNKYGAVVRHDYWRGSRTLTHEIGHCLGLWHMWQDQSLGNWGDGCSFIVGNDCTDNDDMVCDTPPMYQPAYGCNYTSNTCSNDSIGPSPYPTDTLDMIENFMSYSDCQHLFTTGQKERVTAVFGIYPEFQNLVSYNNLVATGTNNGYVTQLCKPKAAFSSNKTMVCKGSSVTFTDISKSGIPTGWEWDFPGGAITTSTAKNPTVQYNTAGTYDVRFISTNAAGNDTLLLEDYVTISENTAQYSGSNYFESFEDSTVTYNDWKIISSNGKARWKRTETAGHTGTSSMMIPNLSDAWHSEIIELVSPSYNVSAVTSPEFTFKVAYSQYDSSVTEYLKVYVSTDCGYSWALRLSRSSPLLETVPDQSAPFTPTAQNQWKEEKISLASYSTKPNVRFKFHFVSARGNNIYIDDINIRQTVGITENSFLDGPVNLYPNPASQQAILDFTTTESISNVRIAVYNILGKTIKEVANLEKLPAGSHNYKIALSNDIAPGIYFVKMTSGSLQFTKKLVVE